jgi:probable rRNA maturation factor
LIKKYPKRYAGDTAVVVRKPDSGLSETTLTRFARRAQRAIGLQGEVNILLTGNDELCRLNSRFRGLRRSTDVLSFPALNENGFVGDLAISVDFARRNARKLRHPPAEEIKILMLHGLLHLAGYDHERDHGEMARREAKVRKQLGLPGGLIERYDASPGNPKSRRTAATRRVHNPRKRRKSE